MSIQTTRGFYAKTLTEINELIKLKRNELKDKGKYFENALAARNEMDIKVFLWKLSQIFKNQIFLKILKTELKKSAFYIKIRKKL
ncbi:unnamed protein product [Meloidogyne enterolobii]|uniref:Uncharacterized protein n=1 Tax=Meloidogyne enterolobii TaxID=390850 RepID=A0ACB0XPT4_MELEN